MTGPIPKLLSKLYDFGAGRRPGREPDIQFLNPEGLDSCELHRPIGPLPHPGGQAFANGSGYPDDWKPAPIVLVSPRVPKDADILPVPDVMHSGGVRDFIVSDRARRFFEATDPEAFTFTATDVLIGRDMVPYTGAPYWRCDVVRFLDALDYDYTPFKHEVFELNGLVQKTPSVFDRNYYRHSVVRDFQIFRLEYRMDRILCTQAFRDSARSANLVIGFSQTWAGVIDT